MQATRASQVSGAAAERAIQIPRRSAQSRGQSEKKTAQQRDAESEKQSAPVELDILSARQTSRPKRYKRMNANECEHDAQRSARNSQHAALGETLTHQPATAGAKGDAHRQLPFTRNRACQQQAGDIHARYQQNEA